MKLLGMQINYANAFVATMIMGVGIDYAIHLVHRLHSNGGVLDEGVMETGKGVALAAATNVAGFGTLAFGNYPAMRSVGIVALIGSLTCLLTRAHPRARAHGPDLTGPGDDVILPLPLIALLLGLVEGSRSSCRSPRPAT